MWSLASGGDAASGVADFEGDALAFDACLEGDPAFLAEDASGFLALGDGLAGVDQQAEQCLVERMSLGGDLGQVGRKVGRDCGGVLPFLSGYGEYDMDGVIEIDRAESVAGWL